MIILYGIGNCDTIRKTARWLDSAGLDWSLHDYRKHGLDTQLLDTLLAQFNPDQLVNRRGATWRKLSTGEQALAGKPDGLKPLLLDNPAMIKRPILKTDDGRWLMGYDVIVDHLS